MMNEVLSVNAIRLFAPVAFAVSLRREKLFLKFPRDMHPLLHAFALKHSLDREHISQKEDPKIKGPETKSKAERETLKKCIHKKKKGFEEARGFVPEK